MHQCPRLVHPQQGERDTELHRRQRDPPLAPPAVRIERRDLAPPRCVAARCLQLTDDGWHWEILDLHPVMCFVPPLAAIQVALADLQRIELQMTRDGVHHRLDSHHPLRPAEAAKRGGGYHVGLAPMRGDRGVAQEIRVVGMKHRTVVDRPGKIGRNPAARGQLEGDALDAAGVIETHVPIGAEIMPLAGQHHVVVTIEPQLDRPPGARGQQRRDHRDLRGLAFLAAESPAQPPRLAHHVVVSDGQRPRRQMLHLRRVLRGTEHMHVVVLAGDRHRDLPFEVEVILPANG